MTTIMIDAKNVFSPLNNAFLPVARHWRGVSNDGIELVATLAGVTMRSGRLTLWPTRQLWTNADGPGVTARCWQGVGVDGVSRRVWVVALDACDPARAADVHRLLTRLPPPKMFVDTDDLIADATRSAA